MSEEKDRILSGAEMERAVELTLMATPGDPYSACVRPHRGDPRGLRYGAGLWTQASGGLGVLLERCAMHLGMVRFEEALGGAEARHALMHALTMDPGGLWDVEGEPLWSPRWVGVLRGLAALPAMRRAQRQLLKELLSREVLVRCRALGRSSQADLACVFSGAYRALLRRQIMRDERGGDVAIKAKAQAVSYEL